jgi:hypothetical protein
MKFRNQMMLFGATMLAAPAAFAQTAPTAPAAPAPAAPTTQTAPAAPAAEATATSATVTDTEVTQFATAAIAISKVQADTAVPEADKTTKFIEAINTAGLQPARFNAIATAMQSDTALNARIQKAGAAAQGAGTPGGK